MILYVLGLFPAPSETFVIRELDELARRGLSVRVLRLRIGRGPSAIPVVDPTPRELLMAVMRAPLKTARLLIDGIRVTRGHWKNIAYWLLALPKTVWAIQSAMSLGITRVHAHWAATPALVARCIAQNCGIPFSFTAHAYDLFTSQSLFGALYPHADAAITVSRHNLEFIRGRWTDDAARRVRVVYCGLPGRFRKAPAGVRTNEMPRRIYSACRFVETKGVDLLIRALPAVAEDFPDVRLILFGEGPLRGNLEALVRRLNILERVEFRGWTSESDMNAAYDGGGIWALPCREAANGDRDGIPVSLLEAMAKELTVVTTPISGIPEVVEHAKNGWLVEPESAAALSRAFSTLFGNPALCRALGEAAGRTIEMRFMIETTIGPLVEVLTRDASH